MNYGSYSDELRRRKLDNPVTRGLTGAVVLLLHLLVIGALVFWGGGCRSTKEPKERVYKVKLGGSEPSHAPEVGPPERLRPTDSPPATPPTPPEPQVKAPPAKPTPSEPTIRKKQPVKKPVKPTPSEPTIRKKQPVKKTVTKPVSEPTVRPSKHSRQNQRSTRQRPKDDGVYHPSGGSNFNPNVRIGSRDAGQKRGPADNRTPMAGKEDAALDKWQSGVQKYVEMLWTPPENVFWDNPPQADLELVIDSDGRVLSARLVKSSGNARMDATIQQLIQQLKGRRAPQPPRGRQTIVVELIPQK